MFKKLFNRILNIGVSNTLPGQIQKKVRIVNFVTLFTFVFMYRAFLDASLHQTPFYIYIYFTILWLLYFVPFILNYYQKIFASRVFFIVLTNILLVTIPMIFGEDFHYQNQIFLLVGVPFILIGNKQIKLISFLGALPLVLRLYLEWHFHHFSPFITVNPDNLYYIHFSTSIFIFIALFVEFYIFLAENNFYTYKVREQRNQLKEINGNLEQFAHVVSHDLKNPIGNISSLLGILRAMDANVAIEKRIKVLDMLDTSTKKSIQLIESILEFSKAGAEDLKKEALPLNEIIEEIVYNLNVPKHINIEYKDKLPSAFISKIHLEQILTNLISNAIKYNDKEVGTIKITTQLEGNDFIKIQISDNGLGIKEQYLESIFNAFSTAHETKRKDSTGVGLAIVKKLIEKYDGVIKVTSELGTGTKFCFTIPKAL